MLDVLHPAAVVGRQWHPARIGSADGEDRRDGCRDLDALGAVVADGCDHKDVLGFAQRQRVGEDAVGLTGHRRAGRRRRRDHVCSGGDCLLDRAGQVDLRERPLIGEDGYDECSTAWRDPLDVRARLAEQHAGERPPAHRHPRPVKPRSRAQASAAPAGQPRQSTGGKRRPGAVEDGHGDPGSPEVSSRSCASPATADLRSTAQTRPTGTRVTRTTRTCICPPLSYAGPFRRRERSKARHS